MIEMAKRICDVINVTKPKTLEVTIDQEEILNVHITPDEIIVQGVGRYDGKIVTPYLTKQHKSLCTGPPLGSVDCPACSEHVNKMCMIESVKYKLRDEGIIRMYTE